jgi:hypothetical protein
MRLYGKRFLKNSNLRAIENHSETRDAILWDVLPAQRICRVKIQGSSQLINAYYPLNWEVTPGWLKPGNAVRITHTGGIRGRIELVGHGTYIPTPVSGDTLPPVAIGEDGIITGCEVMQILPTPALMVSINAGSFRISGTIYFMGAFGGALGEMPLGSDVPLGTEIPLGSISAYGVAIDAAPVTPGTFRYDKVVVGIDSAVDYVKGTNFTSTPVYPETPADHLCLATILTYYGITAITQALINRTWETRKASSVSVIPADAELAWLELSTDVEIGIRDQYSQFLTPPFISPYSMQISFLYGTGTWGSAIPGVPYAFGLGADHTHATYTRNKLVTEHSPILKADLLGDVTIFGVGQVTLLDVGGEPMY